jgi:flagellar biosynthesis protein FlhA
MNDKNTTAIALPKGKLRMEQSEIIMALGVVAIILVMVIPLPTLVLDILLSFSITVSLLVLLTAMSITHPLEFSTFPSILLLTTLFRLSLNIASTRLILLHGNEGTSAAGVVIRSFGNFVVGGNYLVGFIIFIILVIINFVVITKGSGRVAEVAARFTLDAMPGKQMSIDADLNAGLIEEQEARRRRSQIAREAEFYGAMDGASKFVRGEAIAGILIILVNIGGGFIIGVLQQNLGMETAAQTYTILTIGDALVTQIPALIISTAAGIIVTRAASEYGMGKELGRQFKLQPQAMALSAGILFFLGLIPGLPHIPFLLLALAEEAGREEIGRSAKNPSSGIAGIGRLLTASRSAGIGGGVWIDSSGGRRTKRRIAESNSRDPPPICHGFGISCSPPAYPRQSAAETRRIPPAH